MCNYHPQSSEQVERMNQTLKKILTKLTRETGDDWITIAPFALFWLQHTLYYCGLTSHESMLGRPSPLVPRHFSKVMAKMSKYKFLKSMQALQTVQDSIFLLQRHIYELPPAKPHRQKPGDLVWVILTTFAVVKIDRNEDMDHPLHLKPPQSGGIGCLVWILLYLC